MLAVLVLFRGSEAESGLDVHDDVEPACFAVQCREVQLRIDDLVVARYLDVTGGDLSRSGYVEVHLCRSVGDRVNTDLAQVEQELGRVLFHFRNCRELVLDLVDAHGGNRRAADPAEQHTAERVALGMREPSGERLDRDADVVVAFFLDREFGSFGSQDHVVASLPGTVGVWLAGLIASSTRRWRSRRLACLGLHGRVQQ